MDAAKVEKIVLWGSGVRAVEIVCYKDHFIQDCQIMGVFDNDSKLWGKKLGPYTIQPPQELKADAYDKIVVATILYYDEVREQLVIQMKIDEKCIENSLYFAKKLLIHKYKDAGDEAGAVLSYLKDHNLAVFNYPFVENYSHVEADIGFDEGAGMFYVWHKGFRMYMERRLDTEEKVLHYYRSILAEQDEASPHRYLDDNFSVSDGDVVVDVGTAEGNFALEVFDKASRIYLIEAEDDWVEALRYTFADHQDKVVIIQGYASDCTDGNKLALDDVIREKVQFIKMDIEGWEARALTGAGRLIEDSARLKCAVCAYHNDEDEEAIREIADKYGLRSDVTKGYMYYPIGYEQRYYNPVLRRGIVRLEK